VAFSVSAAPRFLIRRKPRWECSTLPSAWERLNNVGVAFLSESGKFGEISKGVYKH
jgi:hypothetical protein